MLRGRAPSYHGGMRWILAATLVLVMACGNDDEYGVVELEFHAGSAASDGQAEVAATVQYLECLTAFYDEHMDLRQSGAEGESIFADWKGRLCDESSVDCEVTAITQTLDGTISVLTVEYATTASIDRGTLVVGPLPTTDTAGCTAEVHLRSVVGRDAAGSNVWTVESFSASDAVVGQGAPISITIGGA